MPPHTKVTGGGWENVGVRDKNDKLTPLTSETGEEVRGSDTSKHYMEVFKFRRGSFNGEGSEFVDINPAANTAGRRR